MTNLFNHPVQRIGLYNSEMKIVYGIILYRINSEGKWRYAGNVYWEFLKILLFNVEIEIKWQ